MHYETAEAAKQAIDKVNGMQIGEKTVFVGEFVPRDGRAPTEVTNFTNIYVKNFPEEWRGWAVTRGWFSCTFCS